MNTNTAHTIDFSQPGPLGYAVCTRCDRFITLAEWVDTRCPSGQEQAPSVPCRCEHGEASHHHLEHCTHENCPCRRYRPAAENSSHE